MQKILVGLLTIWGGLHTAEAANSTSTFSLPLDYELMRTVLVSQLYTHDHGHARLWKDGKDCSFLDLSEPRVQGQQGQIQINNHVHARIGVKLGGKCIPALEWQGELQTLQKPLIEAQGNQLSFPVTAMTAFDQQGRPLHIGELEQLIHKAVTPKLADLKLDLNQSRPDIAQNLQHYMGTERAEKLQDVIDSLHFQQVTAGDKALEVTVGLKLPATPKKTLIPEPVLSADEFQQWQSIWLGVEMRLEDSLQQPTLQQQSAHTRDLLRQTLQEAGQAFESGLKQDSDEQADPVRGFFKQSWDKFGPLLRQASSRMPGTEGLRALTLIAATDVMYEIDTLGAALGLEVSSQGLRRIVRAYLQQNPAPAEASVHP